MDDDVDEYFRTITLQSIKNTINVISSDDLNRFIKNNKKDIEQRTKHFRSMKL